MGSGSDSDVISVDSAVGDSATLPTDSGGIDKVIEVSKIGLTCTDLEARLSHERALMRLGRRKLMALRRDLLPTGVTPTDIQNLPFLSKYTCWTCVLGPRGCGVSLRYSGGPRASGQMAYFQVSVSKDLTFQAQKLITCFKFNINYSQAKLDSSHLCHNRQCWRPDHLHAETHASNMERNKCPGQMFARADGRVFRFCRHEPECLRLFVVESLTSCEVLY